MMKRLSIVAILLLAGCTKEQQPLTTSIPAARARTIRRPPASPISATAARK